MNCGNTTLGRGQVVPMENYKKGARVWVRDPEAVWVGGELVSDINLSTKSVSIRLDDSKNLDLSLTTRDQLPFLQNPEGLLGSDDLTELSYLHEPAVLHNLQYRLDQQKIYTYCGIVLVAINPYADCLPWRREGCSSTGSAYLRVAAEAFHDLAEFGKNQSIIVSGESGAGKTVSAKYALEYFAQEKKGTSGVEKKVLASNPIMEAIGNAKTVRNDNSSRFGKYVQVNFSQSFAISGAEIKTYLLEKSRIVCQSKNERNYHIFYQICCSREHPLLNSPTWRLAKITAIPIKEETAFTDLGFTEYQLQALMRILVGNLSFGNVEFANDDEATHVLEQGSHELKRICEELFDVSETELTKWLTNREIRSGPTGREVVRKTLSADEATRGEKAPVEGKPSFIGVLDIYGFETFDVNSFEQFCINYANEKLQQQFSQHVFKLEQDECIREEIKWVRIEFSDNQPTIDLIEKILGLISLLDEQCKMPRGSDQGWLSTISTDDRLKKNKQLTFPRIKSTSFIVKHFAADVSYEAVGIMEKNKDTVNTLLLDVIRGSKFKLLGEILGCSTPQQDVPVKMSMKTVAGHFRVSLTHLIKALDHTRPHYVRCIKPNDAKKEFYFDRTRANEQLKACGVLETVRISAQGFPSRWNYQEFSRRYRVLFTEGGALWKSFAPKEFANVTCGKHLVEGQFAIGKTMVFFRTGQKLREDRAAARIQTAFRLPNAAATTVTVPAPKYDPGALSSLLHVLKTVLEDLYTKKRQLNRRAITILMESLDSIEFHLLESNLKLSTTCALPPSYLFEEDGYQKALKTFYLQWLGGRLAVGKEYHCSLYICCQNTKRQLLIALKDLW